MESPREKQYKFCPTCRAELARREIDRRQLLACPKCDFIFWNNPKPVTSVILAKAGQVLMVKRKQEPLQGYWVLPGGYIDYGETPQAAAIREAKEETNLDVRIKDLVGVYQIDNDPRGHNIDIIYCADIIGGQLAINEESAEFDFFDVESLPELIAYTHRQAIGDWQKSRPE
ncbi:MAG: NUDIX hydrolase [Patescibacteria group bacterium]